MARAPCSPAGAHRSRVRAIADDAGFADGVSAADVARRYSHARGGRNFPAAAIDGPVDARKVRGIRPDRGFRSLSHAVVGRGRWTRVNKLSSQALPRRFRSQSFTLKP